MCNPFLKERHVNTFKYCRHSVQMWTALGLPQICLHPERCPVLTL